jgi:HTH-type transcriptional regulator/antitoxin HigA
MKATLFVIENDTDHAQAKVLIEQLMGSKDPADQARMAAQARLIEAYELARWPRRAPSLPDLSMSMVRKLRERFHISADLLIPSVPRRGVAA